MTPPDGGASFSANDNTDFIKLMEKSRRLGYEIGFGIGSELKAIRRRLVAYNVLADATPVLAGAIARDQDLACTLTADQADISGAPELPVRSCSRCAFLAALRLRIDGGGYTIVQRSHLTVY